MVLWNNPHITGFIIILYIITLFLQQTIPLSNLVSSALLSDLQRSGDFLRSRKLKTPGSLFWKDALSINSAYFNIGNPSPHFYQNPSWLHGTHVNHVMSGPQNPGSSSRLSKESSPIWDDSNLYLEPQTTIYKWLFQLDDSKSLYRKRLLFPWDSTHH